MTASSSQWLSASMEHELHSCIEAIACCQRRTRVILPMWKEPWNVCQPWASQTGPWPTAESLDCSRKLAFTSLFHAVLSSKAEPLAEGTSTPLESTRLCYQGILVQPYWPHCSSHGHSGPGSGVVFHPHGMRDVFTEVCFFSKAWPGPQLPPCPALGWKELLGILCFWGVFIFLRCNQNKGGSAGSLKSHCSWERIKQHYPIVHLLQNRVGRGGGISAPKLWNLIGASDHKDVMRAHCKQQVPGQDSRAQEAVPVCLLQGQFGVRFLHSPSDVTASFWARCPSTLNSSLSTQPRSLQWIICLHNRGSCSRLSVYTVEVPVVDYLSTQPRSLQRIISTLTYIWIPSAILHSEWNTLLM